MASFFNLSRFGGRSNAKSPTVQPSNASPTLSDDGRLAPPLDQPFGLKSSASQASLQSAGATGPDMSARTTAPDASSLPNRTRKLPFFFREENTGLIVKGNFMTLTAKPAHVETGEWLAHQVVEQYRLLEGMLKVIQEVDQRTGAPLCNPQSCPQMMAANNTIYTWLDNQRNPIRIPASQYVTLVQKWILGKINDARIFPTDTNTISSVMPGGPSTPTVNSPIPAGPTNLNVPLQVLSGNEWVGKVSGFPQTFEHDIKNLYRQMFRCYAHIYYAHWLDPFFHVGLYKELNTCFIHFVNVGKQFDLLMEKDLAPMQPLVDIWLAKDLLPRSAEK